MAGKSGAVRSRREANELYGTLLGPVETLVKDKRSLLVVPSGALTALPFHLLVTEKPAAAIPEKSRAIAMPPGCSSVRRCRCCRRSQA